MKQPIERIRTTAPMVGVWVTAALIALSGPQPVRAGTVYRCGPDLNQYSQQPCADGRPVEVDDPRDAEQISQGRAAARHHAKAERDIAQDLHEMNRHPPAFGSLSPRPAASAATAARQAAGRSSHKKRHRVRVSDPTDFTAYDPASLRKSHSQAGN